MQHIILNEYTVVGGLGKPTWDRLQQLGNHRQHVRVGLIADDFVDEPGVDGTAVDGTGFEENRGTDVEFVDEKYFSKWRRGMNEVGH